MTDGPQRAVAWTGGQYSLVRALTALLAARHGLGARWSLDPTLSWAATGLAGVLLVLLLLGSRARTAALLLAALEIARLATADAVVADSGWAALLLLHACVPAAPWLALAARGRVDPRGNWRMRSAVMPAAAVGAVLHLAWLASGTLRGMAGAAGDAGGIDGVLLAAAWLCLGIPPLLLRPRRHADGPVTVYYDGGCGLCHGAVRFLLAEDAGHPSIRYAPLDSAAYRAAVPAELREQMPETMVVVDGRGAVHSRAEGVLFLATALGGSWRLLAMPARLVPRRWADALYNRLAAVRHRLFRRPQGACPLLPPELQQRFTLD